MALKALQLVLLAAACGCASGAPESRPAGAKGWLEGDTHQKFDTVAKHLRGFDMAMVEVGYRYNELYFAGQDRNWSYAAYHSEKIRVATENGLERRPARAASAREFLDVALPRVQQAIQAQDLEAFNASFEQMRLACQQCHQQEGAPFVQMVTPERRLLPLRFDGGQ